MARKRFRHQGLPVNGLMLLDKPEGISSNEALQRVKRLLNARKGGHTGSLDPMATGLLPLCFGESTKISSLLLDSDKQYEMTVKLGVATETGDREGAVIQQRDVNITQSQLEEVLDRFRGEGQQIPPMYSALKLNGQPLYKLARKGIEVERKPRKVTVYSLILTHWQQDVLKLTVTCSRGFYVRTLAVDIGDLLGCGGHVIQLRRTGVGNLHLDQSVSLPQLEKMALADEREKLLLPTDTALSHLPEVHLPANIAVYLCKGQSVRARHAADTGLVRLYSDNEQFLGIGEITEQGKIAPKRLFHC